MKFRILTSVFCGITLALAVPANASTWFKDTISGVLDEGTDFAGAFGPSGASLVGVPYSLSFYYRDVDIVTPPGYYPDTDTHLIRAVGFIGNKKIPFISIDGFKQTWTLGVDIVRYYTSLPDNIGFYANFDRTDLFDYRYVTINGHQFDGSDFDPTRSFSRIAPGSIPEPATWLMLLAGFGAVGALTRRQKTRMMLSYN